MMEKEEQKASMHKISKVVRHLRMSKGLSAIQLADELDATAMLIDIVEQADTPEEKAIGELIPESELQELAVHLEEVTGRSIDEMYTEVERLDVPSHRHDEVLLYVPVTVSVDRCVEMVDQIITLTANTQQYEQFNLLRAGVRNACLMLQLLHSSLSRQGCPAFARNCVARFGQLIEARKQCLAPQP